MFHISSSSNFGNAKCCNSLVNTVGYINFIKNVLNKIHISSVHVPIYWRKCSRGLEMNHFANQFVFSIVNSFTCVIRIDGTFITSCPLSSTL